MGELSQMERIAFETEARIKIGPVTYLVTAHFDETRETLPDKIRHLLRLEIENKIAQLPIQSQSDSMKA